MRAKAYSCIVDWKAGKLVTEKLTHAWKIVRISEYMVYTTHYTLGKIVQVLTRCFMYTALVSYVLCTIEIQGKMLSREALKQH